MSEKRVKAIINWLKAELENNFKFKRSSLKSLTPAMPGNSGYLLNFESDVGIAVELWYWDTGVINLGACNTVSDVDYVAFWHLPDDYKEKFYPEESEEILTQKVNEILALLRVDCANIKPKIPDSI